MHYFIGVIVSEEQLDYMKIADIMSKHEGKRWDWWRVGGRYDGVIKGICVQSADGGFNFADEHETIKNNCMKISDYLGMRSKDKLRMTLNKLQGKTPFFLPYAVVTPKGRWVSDLDYIEDNKNASSKMIRRLNRYKDYYMVGVDCHY